jgi:acetyl-CoA acetyltransferase
VTEVFIVGVGMTRFQRHPEQSVKQLAADAVRDALADGGVGVSAVEEVYFGNATQGHMAGQHMLRGQMALLPEGLGGRPIINVENACATGCTALHLAWQALRAGSCDVALAVGVDKMVSTDKARALSVFDSAWDVETPCANAQRLVALGAGVDAPPGTTSERPYSVFMDVYAAFARHHMKHYGVTQRQLAIIAAKNHVHAVHNERAQYRKAMSVDEVLAAPPITFPLTLPMCAPVSDGAAAAILCTADALKRLTIGRSRAIRIDASVLRAASPREGGDLARHLTRLAADDAYRKAGLAPADVDVAEVHDATAMGELIQTENLGFCALGDGGRLAESGATTLGGRIPVNPSGGLESKGHPISATGLGQVFELVTQLRGEAGPRQVEGARVGVVENGGGFWGVEEAIGYVGLFSAGRVS